MIPDTCAKPLLPSGHCVRECGLYSEIELATHPHQSRSQTLSLGGWSAPSGGWGARESGYETTSSLRAASGMQLIFFGTYIILSWSCSIAITMAKTNALTAGGSQLGYACMWLYYYITTAFCTSLWEKAGYYEKTVNNLSMHTHIAITIVYTCSTVRVSSKNLCLGWKWVCHFYIRVKEYLMSTVGVDINWRMLGGKLLLSLPPPPPTGWNPDCVSSQFIA